MSATRQLRSDGNKPASRRRRTGVLIPVPPAHKRKFRERLLKWYAQHARDLPWRKTSNPYKILVSEIMLKQSQVDRVLPKYHEWMTEYPTIEELAEAPL